ncbi:unnamed protein product [Durusdinium trenchii]|uniref:Uncharacterized protein n=1 Tax=Durusdinium trenchii TaxID=1381693 RepID=A0ABP0L1X3_9DINO
METYLFQSNPCNAGNELALGHLHLLLFRFGPSQLICQEKPFAGGLIGGESAFSGQAFNFDPLGLSVKCEKYLPWFREVSAELKHGRIAMLAWVGLVVPEFVRIPGPDACYGAKNVVEAHNACAGDPYFPFVINSTDFYGTSGHQVGPLFQVFAFCGLVEMLTTFAKTSNISNKPGLTLENAGDYRLGLNFLPKEPEKIKEMKLKELKNGRLAMLAFGGAITQATLTGNGFPWLYAQKESQTSTFGASVPSTRPRAMLGGEQVPAAGHAKGEILRSSDDGIAGIKQAYDLPSKSKNHFAEVTTTNQDLMKHPKVFTLSAKTRELRTALAEPSGDFGRAGRSSWHYNIARPLGRKVKLHQIPSAKFDGSFLHSDFTQTRHIAPSGRAPGAEVLSVLPEVGGSRPRSQCTGSRHSSMASTTPRRARVEFETIFNRTKLQAESKGYKMSAAVPFLPMSPALEGLPGEEEGFDPMGFSLAIDIRWLREAERDGGRQRDVRAELKHGRVAMLATVGWIATDLGLRVPGEPFQVSTIEAHDAMVKFGSMPQTLDVEWQLVGIGILVWLGYLELFGFLAIINMQEGKTDRKPGDFGLRGFYPADAKGQYDMQVKELRNGRLAMLAFSGIVTVGVLTQEKWPFFNAVVNAVSSPSKTISSKSSFCGAAALSARSNTVACQAATSKSMPFLPKPQNLGGLVGGEAEFDPLGFSDTFDVKWLRESELKHGRVCMLATIGFVAEQYWNFPGCPETPDALQAIYTAPPNLTALLIFIAGYIESSSYDGKLTMLDMFEGEGAKRAPGDLNFGKRFLPGDKEKADELATKELNNGRLAMLAFAGMIHHNLVVKGPLFPLFPEGWQGPQGSWDLDSTAGALNSGSLGL